MSISIESLFQYMKKLNAQNFIFGLFYCTEYRCYDLGLMMTFIISYLRTPLFAV